MLPAKRSRWTGTTTQAIPTEMPPPLAATGRLAHPFEEREKELLRISERLDLRGPDIDRLHGAALEEEREKTIRQALEDLKSMTLTVIDGEFPRELLVFHDLDVECRMKPLLCIGDLFHGDGLGRGLHTAHRHREHRQQGGPSDSPNELALHSLSLPLA